MMTASSKAAGSSLPAASFLLVSLRGNAPSPEEKNASVHSPKDFYRISSGCPRKREIHLYLTIACHRRTHER